MTNLNALWYQERVVLWPLMPLSLLFSTGVQIRRALYKLSVFSKTKSAIPVIVVGNLTVGGTGKTPLVIHIVNLLQQQGYKPGLISRGYQGSHRQPTAVVENSDPKIVGDEPVLLVKRVRCPMVVGQNRYAALEMLIKNYSVDVVISDDGLQHYRLPRHIEIAVIDGQRRFGNGHCLPVGPLREPISRLKEVDFIVANGGVNEKNEYLMQCIAKHIYSAKQPDTSLSLDSFKNTFGQKIHAVAGLGNPDRFFTLLESLGFEVERHVFPDHYKFSAKDISFADNLPIIMTEKDAVKCVQFISNLHWVLPIDVKMDPMFEAQLLKQLKEFSNG